jgi:hypothetical protein
MMAVVHRFTFLLLFAFFLADPSGAQIYKWTDEKGNIQFGDSPPDGVDAESLEIREGPSKEQIEQAKRDFQKELDRRQKLAEIPETETGNTRQDEQAWQIEPAWPPSCSSHLAFQRFPKFNGEQAENLLRKINGEWKGTVTRLVCKRSSDLPDDCKKLSRVVGISTVDKQSGGEWSRCRRIAQKTFKVTEVSSLLGEGRIKAKWNEKTGHLLIQNTLIDQKTSEPPTIHHYLAVFDSLHYLQRKSPPVSGDWPNLSADGNRVSVRYQSKGILAFEHYRPGAYARRGSGPAFRVPEYRRYYQFRVSGQKLTIIEAYTERSPSGITVWDLRR